jgi:hypothetical protein
MFDVAGMAPLDAAFVEAAECHLPRRVSTGEAVIARELARQDEKGARPAPFSSLVRLSLSDWPNFWGGGYASEKTPSMAALAGGNHDMDMTKKDRRASSAASSNREEVAHPEIQTPRDTTAL